jgi:hypothetical protein
MKEKDDKNEQFEEMERDEPQKDKKKIGYNKKSVACFLLLILAITLIVILFNFSITIKKLF